MNYSNVRYDELIKKAKTDFVLDTENRWKALREAEQVLLEDAAVAPLYHIGSAYVQKDCKKELKSINLVVFILIRMLILLMNKYKTLLLKSKVFKRTGNPLVVF